jgi:sigma-B regulation protein RsbU (phosphoserine phosphatase)
MAREVQRHLLPPSCPNLPGAELAARYNPAHAIGGDMYDFLDYKLPRACIAVGDVSGKGAPAALYAALVSGIMRSLAHGEPPPAQMLTSVNRALNQRRLEANYVVLCCALWDDDRKIMRVANSGLPRPIYLRQGHAQMIEAAGLPLGLFEDAAYDEITIHASPGDVFVFLTDGIIDAGNQRDQQFGRARVEHLVAQHGGNSAQEIVDAIFTAVDEFSAGTEVFDDQTVVVLKVK